MLSNGAYGRTGRGETLAGQEIATGQVEYERTVAVSGSPEAALDVAEASLRARGFAISTEGQRALVAKGPGLRSTKQDPLLGVSWARVSAVPGGLRMEAELGGTERMRKLLLLLVAGLEVVFIVGFGIVWLVLPTLRRMPILWLFVIAPTIPWLFFLPFLAGLIRKSTVIALDTFLAETVSEAERRRQFQLGDSDESDYIDEPGRTYESAS